jgi:putative membrane protein
LIALPVGYLLGITQIVPGLSASAILMAIGWFQSLVDSVSFTFWSSSPMVLLLYVSLGVGFLLGIFTFSKLLSTLFEKSRHTSYSAIVGLSLGSIVAMFINGDIIATYASWAMNGIAWLDLSLGIALFIVGIIGSYALVKYQRKKDAE